MYELRNNVGELIEKYTYVLQACSAANRRAEQLSGSRHYVTLGGIMIYETKGKGT